MFQKYLYTLDDKSRGRPLSLEGIKGRDRAVCQILNDLCIEAKLFMLLAEITHEVVDDRGVKRISSSVDRVYTADGLPLTSRKDLNAKSELLGLPQGKLEDLETDNSDGEDFNPRDASEEGKITKRYRNTAVVLVRSQHLLKLLTLHEVSDYNRSGINEEAPDRGVKGVGMMLGKALKVHPDDSHLKTVGGTRCHAGSLWACRVNKSADDN